MEYIVIDSPIEYEKALKELSTEEIIALDTETYVLPEYKHLYLQDYSEGALDPHSSSVAVLAIKGRETPVYLLDIIELEKKRYDFSMLGEYLARRKVIIAHNAKFDCKFIRVITGRMLENWWCTRIGYNLIGNAHGSKFYRQATSYSLASMVRDLLGINLTGKGEEQIEDWSVRPLSKVKLEYVARDVAYLHPCYELLNNYIDNSKG